MKYLYLDDLRKPGNSFEYTQNRMYVEQNWHIVTSYEEFVDYFKSNGIPNIISFDIDLTMYQARGLEDGEKDGIDCLLHLIEVCRQKKRQLPNCLIHSTNPARKKEMLELIREGRELLKTMPLSI